MPDLWIVNGRCESCLEEHLEGDGDDPSMCGCWCHDTGLWDEEDDDA